VESGKGGSVAGAAFSPCGTLESYTLLDREIMKNLFRRNERILGKVIFAAKCSVITWYPTDDVYYGPAVLYTLFGDPALRIKLPLPTAVDEPARPPAPALPCSLSITPNPARTATVVSYSLPRSGNVRLVVHNPLGRLTTVLTSGYENAGRHSVALGAYCDAPLPRGVYLLTLEFDACRLSQKLVCAPPW
jgi:hypothetical protein